MKFANMKYEMSDNMETTLVKVETKNIVLQEVDVETKIEQSYEMVTP